MWLTTEQYRDRVKERLVSKILGAGVDLNEDGVGNEEENARRIADAVLGVGMRVPEDPGAPESDELARNAARNGIRDMLDGGGGDGVSAGRAGPVADHLARYHSVTFERDVNSAGVPVRRYAMRGEWVVDVDGLNAAETLPLATSPAQQRAVRSVVEAALTIIAEGPRVWSETALDAVKIERVRGALRRAALAHGVIL